MKKSAHWSLIVAAVLVGGSGWLSVACGSTDCADTANCALAPDTQADGGGDNEREAGQLVGPLMEGRVIFSMSENKALDHVGAGFSPFGAVAVVEAMGLCQVRRFRTTTYLSAGDVLVSGGAFAGETALLPVAGVGAYTSAGLLQSDGGPSLFTKGDVLRVRATGDAFPAFEAQSVTAPGALALVTPTASVVDSKSNLTVTWTGGEASATAHVRLSQVSSDVLDCEFDALAGSGSVPSTLLERFRGASCDLELVHSRSTNTKVGPHSLSVTVNREVAHRVSVQ